jgi:fido (protein-threonine AMPylation protein)
LLTTSDGGEFLDPYLDPETGILHNLIGARTKESLDDAEGSLSFARLVQLTDHPLKPTGDLTELRAIHRHLFQDLYDWAGQIRTVDIRKNAEGAEFFLPFGMIERASSFASGNCTPTTCSAVWTARALSTGSHTTTTRSTTSTRSATATVACSGYSGTGSR